MSAALGLAAGVIMRQRLDGVVSDAARLNELARAHSVDPYAVVDEAWRLTPNRPATTHPRARGERGPDRVRRKRWMGSRT